MKKKSHEKTAKQRPDLHDPLYKRRVYLAQYRIARKALGMGASEALTRDAFRTVAELLPWADELNEYERETVHSIMARALADAIAGKPCPIWGFELDTPKRRTKHNGRDRRKDNGGSSGGSSGSSSGGGSGGGSSGGGAGRGGRV
jgi:uncharacterized membrane protein YgcG